MTSVETESDLVRCFRDVDRADVELPADVRLPIFVDPVFTWSFGPRVYLLVRGAAGGLPKGLVFHRNAGASPDVATMCQWCHRVRSRGGVKMLSVRAGSRRWVGQYLCSDLGCLSDDDEAPSVDDLRETTTREARVRRTLARIDELVSGRLF
jgi:hypothetical protein